MCKNKKDYLRDYYQKNKVKLDCNRDKIRERKKIMGIKINSSEDVFIMHAF